MRFSFDWLRRHLHTELDIQQIADKLTSIGLEVESVNDPALIFKNFKLVQIKDATKHPDADNLKMCVVVDAAGNEFNIVCGAKNARAGLKTVLALPGAVIPSSGEVLKKSKIRGIVSEGMMCSPSELALPSKEDGIIEIDQGVDLSMFVGDALGCSGGGLDVSVTPNRGDCFSVLGIARDLAAAGAGKFIDSDQMVCVASFEFPLKISCDNSDFCCQYAPIIAFRVIRGVKNGKSPQWLKMALQSTGLNSISTLVDLSNIWMMDTGRPTHIYDLKKVKGNLEIRFAKTRESFEDIKGNQHKLLSDMLVVADEESPLCLLGVMGGKKTACDEDTTDILIESGLFDSIFVSKTGALLNITSDSRTRFERGVDKSACISGLDGITKLILDNCGGEASEVFVVGEQPKNNTVISLRKSKLRSVSGGDIDWNEAKLVLKKLGLKEIESKESESSFLVPSWRSDLSIEEDLVEEILRIVGYDNIIPQSIEATSFGTDKVSERKKQIIAIKRLLAARGLSEIVAYSFIRKDCAEMFMEDKKLINLINPISADLSVMRPSLLPTLLSSAVRAMNYGQTSVCLCESGNIFHGACEQEINIAGIRIRDTSSRNWLDKGRNIDVFDVKGDVFAIAKYCKIDEKSITTTNAAPPYYHPSRSGTIMLGKKKLAYFGELHPGVAKLLSICKTVVCFEVFVDQLPQSSTSATAFSSKVFPKIVRDFAFLFNANAHIGNIINAICKLDPLIADVSIFDCFDFDIMHKSIGISIVLDAINKTLTEDEAQVISDKVVTYVEGIGGKLRGKK
ncbi:MAG: phenylalanine--tRNA ligase subunit beta [Holosporaceae bacterium]|jgi:phenylalanyl-tRNA synthetase beta chain|nr:phenylalanine--tRNA ligase subunit beta [Holosporaceae bacterium]